jgi:hypothetical protein
MSYIRADFDSLDGEDLRGYRARSLLYVGRPVPLNTSFVFEKFHYAVDTILVSGTYGISDNTDARVVLPLLHSSIAVRQASGSRRASVRESAFGPGDVRGEFRWKIATGPQWGVGFLGSVRFPTGDEQDLQGLGDWSIKPVLLGEYGTGKLRASFNGGFDVNLDDASRTVAVYGAGLMYLVRDRVALNVELIGTSQMVEAELPDDFGELSIDQASTLEEFNSIRVAPSLKVSLPRGVYLFGGVLIPVTDDGLQAAAIPLCGIEWQF